MGADIHGVVQTRWADSDSLNNKWRNIMEIEDGRNYALFSALANVRNHFDIQPIAPNRGLPDDFEMDGNGAEHVMLYYSEGSAWMGEHSYTYYSLEEIANWDGWDQAGRFGSIIGSLREDCDVFLKWIDYLKSKYSDGHHDVRIVIGFDN